MVDVLDGEYSEILCLVYNVNSWTLYSLSSSQLRDNVRLIHVLAGFPLMATIKEGLDYSHNLSIQTDLFI